jgi:NADH dehydrogenase
VEPPDGDEYGIDYDHVVVALGSVARTLPIPGLAEQAIGFKHVEEAIALRNQVLGRLDVAASIRAASIDDASIDDASIDDASIDDGAKRRRALTFVFVGGGYAGVEAFAELEDMARYATRYYDNLEAADMRWVLVEATGRILPEVGEDMGRYTIEQLRSRSMEVLLDTRLESCVDGHVELSGGQRFDADTIVWTAGVKANPVVAATGLPLDERGRIRCGADLRVVGFDDVWAAGDNAAVPDLSSSVPGATCSPSAQHAVRQAKVLARNLLRVLAGNAVVEYRHRHVGSVASLGLRKGVAQVYGIKLKGFPAWFMHRTYHLSRVPTFNRKARVVLDWTLALFFRREVVSLGSLHHPSDEFRRAAST